MSQSGIGYLLFYFFNLIINGNEKNAIKCV